MKFKSWLVCAAAVILSACGGGDDDGGDAIPELAPYAGSYSVKVAGANSHNKFQGRGGQTVQLRISGNTVKIADETFVWDGAGDAVVATQSIGSNPQPMTNIKVDGPNNSFVSVDFTQGKSLSNVILYQPLNSTGLFGGFVTFVP